MNTITKTCNLCNKQLDINKFHKRGDKYRSYCKSCAKDYYIRNRKERLEYSRQYNIKHPDNIKKSHSIYYIANRDRLLKNSKDFYKRRKIEVLNHYTNNNIHCQCPSGKCTETAIEFMTIDHIDGNGNKHRKDIGHTNIYQWLKNNNYPSGYRALCFNCNCALGFFDYCPHQQ